MKNRYCNVAYFIVFLLCLVSATLIFFSGCRSRHTYYRSIWVNGSNSQIEIEMLKGDSDAVEASDLVLKRQWTSPKSWYPKPESKLQSLNVTFVYEDSNSYLSYGMSSGTFDANITWPQKNQPGEPIEMAFESSLGKMLFDGQVGSKGKRRGRKIKYFGMVTVEIDKSRLLAMQQAFGDRPSLQTMMRLIIKEIDADKINEYSNLGIKFTIEQAANLTGSDYTPAEIKKLVDSGHKFDAKGIVKLARHHVSLDYINDWKDRGYVLSADKLVYATQRHLSSAAAVKWKDAGYKIGLEKLYWIQQRHLDPAMAVKWQQTGYKRNLEEIYWIQQRHLDPARAIKWQQAGYTLSLEEIYWIQQRHLNPAAAVKWDQAGYKLSLEELYWIQQRHLSCQQAAMWKEVGYDLSLEELYKLQQHNIDGAYGAALADSDFELITVEEMIKFKNAGISKETIRKLRKRK